MGKLDNLFNKIDEEGLYDMKTSIFEEKAYEIIDCLGENRDFVELWECKESKYKQEIINKISKIIKGSDDLKSEETVTDGFGRTWSKKCPTCGKDEVFVVRPGKVKCGNCGY